PGAVAAAQALPEDCGTLPPLVAFCARSSDIVRGSLVTVMSAPIRASQNENTDCFTFTAEEPLALAFDDQFIPLLAAACARFLAAMMSLSVPASIASWPQSSLSTSMLLSTSGSLTSGVSAASVSSSGAAAEGGMICAEAVSTAPKMNAATSTGSLVQPKLVENSIVLPASPVRTQDAELSLRNCGAGSHFERRTNGPRGRRAPDDELLRDGIRRGWRPGRVAGASIYRSRQAGPVGVSLSRRW